MMIASLHQSELYIVETSDTVLIAKHSIYIRLEIQSQSFHGILWMQYPPSGKRRETVTIAVCPLHIFIWKSSRMLLKKLYFIVLFFAFKLMSIKYTLTCVQHMWACNTTWNINNKNAHLSTQDYFWKKIHPVIKYIKIS